MIKRYSRNQTLNQPRPNKEALAYLAGFFDGEGSIQINVKAANSGHSLRLAVTGTDPEPIEMFQKAFGGSVHKRRGGKPNHKPQTFWMLTATPLIKAALMELLPHLTVKRTRAELVITWPSVNSHRFSARLTDTEKIRRDELIKKMSRLNRRGL